VQSRFFFGTIYFAPGDSFAGIEPVAPFVSIKLCESFILWRLGTSEADQA